MKSGEDSFSHTWFMNCNLAYCTIYSSDYYQRLCLSPEVKADIERRECIIQDFNKLTSGESPDFAFENQNKILKRIVPPNPTFDDWRTATLIKEELEEVFEKVDNIYLPSEIHTVKNEAGFPNYSGCVTAAGEVVRLFIGSAENEAFENLSGNEMNPEVLNFDIYAKVR